MTLKFPVNENTALNYKPFRRITLANGGRVTISRKNAEAIQAVHDFLRFQIREHKTGDVQEVR